MDYRLIRYTTVGSTNAIAKDLASQGAEDATVILAEQQTSGRGRLSRIFASPRGGLYMSVIMRPKLAPENLSLITLAAGAACASAIETIAGVNISLKWPNDLYLGGRKLGGILTEAAPYSPSEHKIPFVVVGIGVNVNTRRESFSPELQDTVTSLYDVQQQEYPIDTLTADIVRHLYTMAARLEADQQALFAFWRQRDFLLGKDICWQDIQGHVVRGRGDGLLADGRYQLKTSDGQKHPVLAGDLTVSG